MGILSLFLAMYEGEPCRVCGKPIKMADITSEDQSLGVVYAGYSICSKSRSAHTVCWNENKDRADTWAYPESAPMSTKN